MPVEWCGIGAALPEWGQVGADPFAAQGARPIRHALAGNAAVQRGRWRGAVRYQKVATGRAILPGYVKGDTK